MSMLDVLMFGYREIVSGASSLVQRDTLEFVGATVEDDAVNKRTKVTIEVPGLPAGVATQLLQHDGSAWASVSGISAALLTSGTLGVARGGTGVASYTAGDLMYASAATTLAKLPIGATGQVLVSSGTAPQWAYVTSMRSAVTLQPQLIVGPDEGPAYPGQVAITDDGGVAVAMTWSGAHDSRTGEVVQLEETWEITGETVPGQINGLSLSGATMGNTDAGRVYVTIEADGADNMVTAYSDAARTVAVASGLDEGKAGGAVALSGAMSGVIDIDASALPDATAIATLGTGAVCTVAGAPVGELGRPFAGIMHTNGASDGESVWVVVAGKAKVLTYAGAAAGGYLYLDTARAYPDDGKADCEITQTAAYADHGIGRALERGTSGLVLTELDLRGSGPVLSA